MNESQRHRSGFRRSYTQVVVGLIIIALAFSTSTVNAQSSHLGEFSESGDISELYGQWKYLTQDGLQRTIDVYKYCQNQACLFVPYDISKGGECGSASVGKRYELVQPINWQRHQNSSQYDFEQL